MTDIDWWAAGPAILAALGVVLVPGLVALAPLRSGILARLALAGPLSILSIGVAGILYSLGNVAFAPWQPLSVAAFAGIVVGLLRRRGVVVPGPAPIWPFALTWLGSALVISVVAFAAVPSAGTLSQTYDNVFHVSAIADILRDGDASSLTLRTMIETDRTVAFYPAAWHSIAVLVVQLAGASIPVAVNASWIAVTAAVWLPGVAWLSQTVLTRVPPTTTALVALPLGSAFGAMPYALLTWGTLYPTFLATAILPAGIAVPILAWRGVRAARRADRTRVLLWGGAGALATAGAIALSQPRVLATWTVLLAVPAAAVAAGSIRRGWRAGGERRHRVVRTMFIATCALAVVAAGAAWYAVAELGFFDRPLDDRLGGPQAAAVQPLWAGAAQVLAQSWLTGDGADATAPSILLAASVVFGAIVAWRTRRLRWLVVAAVAVAVLFVIAAGSDDVVTKLATALWYKDRFRLSSAIPILGVPLATLGIVTGMHLLRRPAVRRGAAVGGAWIVALTSALTVALTGMSATVAAVFRLPETGAAFAVVSREQAGFFASLGDIVPADQRVLGDPWDGSAWTLALGDREPVFPHVNGQWDAARQVVAWRLADIESDPTVCDALDALRVRYLVYDPHHFGGGDPAGNHFPGPHAAVEAGTFSQVAAAGNTRLYEIEQCGPLPAGPGLNVG